jgi:hypothetical protein
MNNFANKIDMYIQDKTLIINVGLDNKYIDENTFNKFTNTFISGFSVNKEKEVLSLVRNTTGAELLKYYKANKLISGCFKIVSLKIVIISDKDLVSTNGIAKILLTANDGKIANDFTIRVMLKEKIYKQLHEDKIKRAIVIFSLGDERQALYFSNRSDILIMKR